MQSGSWSDGWLSLQSVIIDSLLKDTTYCPRDLHGFAAYNKEIIPGLWEARNVGR